MKKLLTLATAFLLASATFLSTPVSANDEINKDEVQEKINEIQKDYMQANGIEDSDDLSNEQILELVDIVNDYKSTVYTDSDLAKKSKANLTFYSGDLFLTLDAATQIIGDIYWNHGHAGIGGEDYGEVIEANPGKKIKVYKDRYTYWNLLENGGVYKVQGAVDEEYSVALDYALDCLGLDYGFNALSNKDFYCSELVYYAWKEAGYDLDHDRDFGEFILPKHLMLDAETILHASFPNGI